MRCAGVVGREGCWWGFGGSLLMSPFVFLSFNTPSSGCWCGEVCGGCREGGVLMGVWRLLTDVAVRILVVQHAERYGRQDTGEVEKDDGGQWLVQSPITTQSCKYHQHRLTHGTCSAELTHSTPACRLSSLASLQPPTLRNLGARNEHMSVLALARTHCSLEW